MNRIEMLEMMTSEEVGVGLIGIIDDWFAKPTNDQL